MSGTIIATAEDGIRHLEAHPPAGDRFELPVSGAFTFKGKPDHVGFGMALILDRIIAMGYEPDGFEQKDGFRLYKYKRMR